MQLKRTYLGFGLAAVLALVATAFFLADQIQTTSAASSGPEMRLTAEGCAADCTFDNSAKFTLTVEIIEGLAGGYVGAQSFIDFGSDLSYDLAAVAAADEILWPDCTDAVALHDQPGGPTTVNHGCLTGLIPPLPLSTATGSFAEVSITCSAGPSTTDVALLPAGDPVAGTSGTGFSAGAEVIPAKVSTLSITCGAGAPPETPTTAPVEATPTTSGPTATPGPTDTPAPATDTPVPPTATPVPDFVCGDVNRDGEISTLDALWVLWFDAGLVEALLPLKDNNQDSLLDLIGDIDGDRVVNSIDAALILQIVAGNGSDFCVPPA